MIEIYVISLSLLAYMLGSVPSAVWIGESMFGMDVRDFGSGNAGATNTFRVLGKKAGIYVLALDVIKGFTAASLVYLIPQVSPLFQKELFINLQLLFGLLAVIGHLYPMFAQFKGGKGIATLFGMIIAIHYLSALGCVAIFLVLLLSTRFVSLSSISAAILFPVSLIWVFKRHEPLFIAFGICAAVLVVLTHKKNIDRLLNGNESKARLLPKHFRD